MDEQDEKLHENQETQNTRADQIACDPHCGCGDGVSRREFVSILVAAVGVAGIKSKAMAGPFEAADFDKLVPADKKARAGVD